jgi:hypothetical protein
MPHLLRAFSAGNRPAISRYRWFAALTTGYRPARLRRADAVAIELGPEGRRRIAGGDAEGRTTG